MSKSMSLKDRIVHAISGFRGDLQTARADLKETRSNLTAANTNVKVLREQLSLAKKSHTDDLEAIAHAAGVKK